MPRNGHFSLSLQAMTQIERDALILFKDHTHLQLKRFQVEGRKVLESYDRDVVETALSYHRIYMAHKLNNNTDGNKKNK